MAVSKERERNLSQIIRKDAKNCFMEVKSDTFSIGKIHLEFTAYDMNRPEGERATNHVNIYIDVAEYLNLAHYILHGGCHSHMMSLKKSGGEAMNKPLYQSLGGTSAAKLAYYGNPRKDGMSQSRVAKLFVGKKSDYLFCAESGPGEENEKKLIVPRYGRNPEQKVTVSLSTKDLNELMLAVIVDYQAWRSVWYAQNYQSLRSLNGKVDGKVSVEENGNNSADDMKMF